LAAAQVPSPDAQDADRAAIEITLERFLEAWNTHDAHAFSLVFTEDADFTNVMGVSVHGRENVESFHAPIYATIFKASHLTSTIRSIRFLTSDLAAVDVDWRMTGAFSPVGAALPERRGLLVWIMARQADGSWLIAIMHNAEINRPPGPPPPSPPK
jgi:uncharacterized protein (TIGR02246 family)